MHRTLSLPACLLAFTLCAQPDAWRRLLITDPFMANGYFLVDEVKRTELQATKVTVDLIVQGTATNGTITTSVVQHLEIVPPAWYTHVDLGLLPTLASGERAGYHVQAINAAGIVVLDFLPWDGEPPREEICRNTCNAPAYAWTLVASQNAQQSNTVISIQEGTYGGSYFYFYVKASSWNDFIVQFDMSDFGLNGDWGVWASDDDDYEVMMLPHILVPSNAKDYQGLPLALTAQEGAYAIRKAKGQWSELFAATEPPLLGTDFCNEYDPELLRSHYNGNGNVQFALAQLGLNPLSCEAMISSGGGVIWGPGGVGVCTEFAYSDVSEDTDNDGELDPVGWVSTTVECPPTVPDIYGEPTLSSVSSICIYNWSGMTPTPTLSIPIPNIGDPRLVPVPKTTLMPGLYEYRVIFDNGMMVHKFQQYSTPITINANFASFTHVTAYPVPVTGTSFALDIETLTPMDINLTVIDNQGTSYYSAPLSFPLAGRNKHVVNIGYNWPSGIYHCILQYADGSTETVQISVQ